VSCDAEEIEDMGDKSLGGMIGFGTDSTLARLAAWRSENLLGSACKVDVAKHWFVSMFLGSIPLLSNISVILETFAESFLSKVVSPGVFEAQFQ
jgi:hypothetical protein